MIFADPADYDRVDMEDTLEIHNLLDQMQTREVEITDVTKDFTFKARLELSSRVEDVSCGGQLRYLKRQLEEMGR